ncbi:MAG: choice-of-anchor J domain-containing protein [Prevotellaceae bacterium]|jgi:hypothetical protein|nr:choice-of-anchor J domain-containing protein [Prevotellaceae bacterium]
MKQNILWVISLCFAAASCDMEKNEPLQPAGLTQLHETFEALSNENSISRLSGWTNIMVVDATHAAPLQWLAYETGCNVAMQASAHKFDDSNRGISYESWLLTPPLDFGHAASKTLSFRMQASHWQEPTTIGVYLVENLAAIGKPEKLILLPANLPEKSSGSRWIATSIDLSKTRGVAMVGFCYRGLGGSSASTSFRVDDVIFGGAGSATKAAIFEETFENGLGSFTPVSASGAQSWEWNSSAESAPYMPAAKVSGYTSGASYPNEDWLISPPIDLSGAQSAILTFEHNINKGVASADAMKREQAVLISTSCTDASKPGDAAWEPLTALAYPSGSTWTFACSGKLSLAQYAGSSNVRVAFKYTCGNDNAATWSIANFKVVGEN